MSKKASQLLMLTIAFLLLYLGTTALSGLPAILCMLAAVALTLTCMVQMIMDIRNK